MPGDFIPLSVPNFRGNELEYVSKAIKTEWVSTAGAEIKAFEEKFAQRLNIKYATAVQSGTAGLHLCLRHFGISKNDIVLVPTLTFIATVNPVVYENAEPVFFDCDDHLCIDTVQIESYLKEYCLFDGERTIDKKTNKQVKAIIPVHLFGDAADIDHIMRLAREYNLIVIEDAAESLGSRFINGEYTGTIGHAGFFSFNGNKIITTGGGGMVVSHDKACIDHVKYLSQQAKDDDTFFINNEIGYNYRMTNLQAALGIAQLEQFDNFIEIKRDNFYLYKNLLHNKKGIRFLDFSVGDKANFWFYSLMIENGNQEIRDRFIKYMMENKIQVRPIWKLNHTQKPYLNNRHLPCSRAEDYYNKIVNLPCSSNLSTGNIEEVCQVIKQFNFAN